MKFKVTWPDGRVEDDVSEANSSDEYAMIRWGCNSAESVYMQYGVGIEGDVPVGEAIETEPAPLEETD